MELQSLVAGLGRQHYKRSSLSLSAQAILRPFHYAIVDEADSLLIDECRNPLIISSEPDDTAAERFLLAHKVQLWVYPN